MFELLLCPKSYLELQTVGPKWGGGPRLALRGAPSSGRGLTNVVKGADLGLVGGSPTIASEDA